MVCFKMIWTKDKEADVLRLHDEGFSAAEIAKKLDIQIYEVDLKLDDFHKLHSK